MGTTLRRTPIFWAALLLLAMAVGALALLTTAGTARAEDTGPDVAPTPIGYNATCKDLLDDPDAFEIKIDPPRSGTYGPITVNFRNNGTVVDFQSTVKVLSVFVKGGRGGGGNYYDYSSLGGSSGDTNLIPNSQQSQQISHVSFCWNEEPPPPDQALQASKTAVATYDRKIEWSLKKTVDDASHSGKAGETAGTSNWKVEATKTETESNFEVTGVITITNPNDKAVDFDVYDTLNDGTAASVDCDKTKDGAQASGTVGPNSSVECPYTSLPTTKEGVNQNNVLVDSKTEGVPGTTALALFEWKANVTGDESVTLADDHLGYSQVINDSTTFTEPETFTCPSDPSKYTDGKYSFEVTNTATLTNVPDASATVDVDCSLAALTATKTAAGTYDRKISWDLTKTVGPQSTFNGLAGDSFNANWYVAATKSAVDSNYKVTGDITVSNPAAIAQTFSVGDKLDDGTVASVDCDSVAPGSQTSVTVAAGGTAKCLYTASPTTKNATLNTATLSAPGNKDVTATAAVSFTPKVIGDASVTLADARFSYSQMISDSLQKTFPETFKCPTDRASYNSSNLYTTTFTNTATLKGVTTNLSKSASVTLNCRYPWQGETATGAGTRYPNTSNWFMYTAYTTNKVDLVAGRTNIDAGDIYMTRSGGYTYITITLNSGFRWANSKENLKINPYPTAPTTYVVPGSFKSKFNVTPQTTVTYQAKISGVTALYYGIHADVERYVP